ncbi:MarR family transcriptional regulator [Lactiplantibacillus sp. WILCCON 0030]|uniref:MarR family transcriptional regulator n=1 Tax=Lactiplantibacillus brownii TaxID=3069269 RepID=A0ABU1AB48_9LACO|nr:MarR family transcriptional regulator [Lactiplantibacillus brownii]MDQ7938113.1 MarR family transcriptional regulator [Lactiplantibacillus brownii]
MNDTPKMLNDFLKYYSTVLRYMDDYISEPISQFHLTFDAFLIMHEIGTSSKPLLLMDIAASHHVSRSAISRQISILLKYDYVYQVANPADRRQKSLLLTEKGQDIDRQLIAAIQDVFDSWVNKLGSQRVEGMLDFFNDFTKQVIQVSAQNS